MKGQKSWKQNKHEQSMKELSKQAKKRKEYEKDKETWGKEK